MGNDIITNSRLSGKTTIMVMHIKTELQNNRSVGVVGMGQHLRIIKMLGDLGVSAKVKPMTKNKKQIGFIFENDTNEIKETA